ncbi:bifunctional metallophosphatase/5'-nucleotidase [candidate division CSSED10-310 bacterium]|uniref:Bifunctional metallophosphatase/5'-nucleotidase n=1 Tax=candidate division CSSED10-310 bacterium TaxID=2855610 RepID=A0ABV6YX89_UNCC1
MMKSNQRMFITSDYRILVLILSSVILGLLMGCTAPSAAEALQDVTTVTLLFTNDIESAYDPTPAYWRDDMKHIGGVAQLATLIDTMRQHEPNVFLFDAGDIFTGTLSKLTQGELPFELMITMQYDAMAIGNHEFEYGWENFARQKHRVPFPVLSANMFYKETDILYAQPYTIIERSGIRIGVIGIMGQDAATALIPAHIAGLEVRDPVAAANKYVRLLRPDVDLIVLLTHQGKTAPMQTDDENPDVKRDINADIDLAGAVPGIDVLFGGHADAGTEKPVVHPDSGTVIMQTYGQAFYLGFLQLKVDLEKNEILDFEGRLIPVDSEKLVPHSMVAKKLSDYRARFPDIYKVVGQTAERLNRRYNAESDIGNLFADILRHGTNAQIGLINSGAIRRDLPRGKLTRRDLLDAFPFTDRVVTLDIKGVDLLAALEQSLTLERGMLQVSGLTINYDLKQSRGSRVLSVLVGDEPLIESSYYRVATIEIVAQGGDLYKQFLKGTIINKKGPVFSELIEKYTASKSMITTPQRGRLLPKM